MNRWDLYVTDQVGVRQAVVDTYETVEIFARINDVGTWELVLPTDTEAGRALLADSFARLEVTVDQQVWRSGPVTHLKRTVDIDGDALTVTGVDDTIWLARRNAHPQPATPAPPYGSTSYDVHSGPVSTVLAELVDVNAGPGAVTHRRVAGLTVPVPAPAGPDVEVLARWQNLLTLAQDTARPHGVLFDVVDLAFRAYLPADRGVIFSADLESLGGWTLTSEAAAGNNVVVAGGGSGTARVIREQTDDISVGSWGLAETFVDRRDTTDLAELDQAGAEALADGVKPVTVTFVPLDTEGQAFGRDWGLGDTVTVKAGDLVVVDQIREIHVTLDETDVTIVPSVGARTGDLALFRSLAGLDRRLRQLERI
jgi:Siphovirus ReqiPepy6 Gp37-like protein